MGLAFVIESFKFYRLRSTRTVQALFLLGFVINLFAIVFPVGDRDFSRLISWLLTFSQSFSTSATSLVTDGRTQSVLSIGNLIFIAFSLLITVFNFGIALVYASAMNANFDNYPVRKGVSQFISRIPTLSLFALLMIAPYTLSLLFLQIPFLVLASYLAFAPMMVIDRRWNLRKALDESIKSTAGIRLQLIFTYFFVVFVINGPRDLLLYMVPKSIPSQALITAFFKAVQLLVLGRLYALYYLYYSRSYPNRRLHNVYSPHDPSTFFKEVNQRGLGEDADEDDAKTDEDDDSLF